MEAEINYSQAPRNYRICQNRDCSRANTCLRQLVEQSLPADTHHLTVISPEYLSSLEGACPYYRSAAKVRYAKGFVRLLGNLPYIQMQSVISRLTGYFSHSTYYRVRKGERLISPSEQQKVLQILKDCGVSHPQEFDAYIEDYDW